MRYLTVFSAFLFSFDFLTKNIRSAFLISWFWLLLLAPVQFFMLLLPLREDLLLRISELSLAQSDIMFAGGMIITLLSSCSIAVSWHRLMLLNEQPSSTHLLRLDRFVWLYLACTLLIMIVALLLLMLTINLVVIIEKPLSEWGMGGVFLAFLIEFAVIALIVTGACRMAMKLPAVAIGRRDFTWAMAWRATRDNFIQFIAVLFLLTVIWTLGNGISWLIMFFFSTINGKTTLLLSFPFIFLIGWLLQIFATTLLTSIYGFFVEGWDFEAR